MIGYIYKIHCNVTGKDYYGSSRDIKSRLKNHILKSDCTSVEVLAAGNWTHTIMEEVEYDGVDTAPLRIRETYYIDNFTCVNIIRPYRTKEEENEYMKQYRKTDKYKTTKKAYYEANKEHVKEKARANHEANKEAINARNAERIQCGCGTEHARSSTARHKRTTKHTDWVKSQEKE